MIYNKDAEAYAVRILEERRQRADTVTSERKQNIASKVPEYNELESKRRQAAILKIRAVLLKDNEMADALSSQMEEIAGKMRKALGEKGFSMSDLDDFHYCSKCGDTGILPDGSECSCKKILKRDYITEKLNKESPLRLSSLDAFRLDYYSDVTDSNLGVSPRILMKNNLETVKTFIDRFPNSGNLLMLGASGLGKTHLALGTAKELINREYTVLYISSASVFNTIDAEMREGFSRSSDTLENLKTCDLMVLDDLGTETVNAAVLTYLYDVLESRINTLKPTIITTNLTTQKLLSSRYGDKITSRLFGCFKVMYFAGSDIRLLKNM